MIDRWVTDLDAANILGVSLATFHRIAEDKDWACRVPADGVRRYLFTQITDTTTEETP